MDKHTSYAKLSKRKKRELDAMRRSTWGSLNPVTRKPPDSRVYKRAKERAYCRIVDRQGAGI